ncbi:hypothetical protein BU24DRAFT_242272 [Aaosphaeria arxii CBS 175.79]|uniref:Uncharacterized protein n=1 Tax=Aaosphaeria arxii CBS 175.79 TaxID=1450172 RepID=A0A6A5XLM4_9PLEO|nr:uncharacterized protein BU24DRAFT_242272 [Aaosphaeria arxii CBS 175.79]KAF2013650.1 hypothetical protein BU24DRAFT_242272 [Aaosphaeria arxii CBS 175.79]
MHSVFLQGHSLPSTGTALVLERKLNQHRHFLLPLRTTSFTPQSLRVLLRVLYTVLTDSTPPYLQAHHSGGFHRSIQPNSLLLILFIIHLYVHALLCTPYKRYNIQNTLLRTLHTPIEIRNNRQRYSLGSTFVSSSSSTLSPRPSLSLCTSFLYRTQPQQGKHSPSPLTTSPS